MSIKEQMLAIQGFLGTFNQQNGGVFATFICSDYVHLWKLLFDTTQSEKVLIMYAGESQRVNFPGGAITGRVDREFSVVISRGRSLQSVDRGLALTMQDGNAQPLFDIVEQYRDLCRGFVFDPLWCERPVDYAGIRQFPVEGTGAIVDAYMISFKVGVQLGMLEQGDESDQMLVGG